MNNDLRVLLGDSAQVIVVQASMRRLSNVLQGLLQCIDGSDSAVIPLRGITSEVFAKVAEYCEHLDTGARLVDELTAEYEAAPHEAAQMAMLFDVIKAADYLDIQSLVDDACEVVAHMIEGRTPEEIRCIFGIKNDLSFEEVDTIEQENRWAF